MKNFNLYLIILSLALISCDKQSMLEQALVLAGENRPELEKILVYYSHDPADSLKLRAAK